MASLLCQQRVDDTVGRAAGGKRVVRDFQDPPSRREARERRRDVAVTFEKCVITIRTLEHVLRAVNAGGGHVMGHHGRSRAKSELHAEQRPALDMRLHGPANLAKLDSEGVDQCFMGDTGGAAEGRHRAETAGGGGTEEPERRLGADADRARRAGQPNDHLRRASPRRRRRGW